MTKYYNKFRGVDFSTDPALIDESRSPYSQNLISDNGGYPEKRVGWETKLSYEGEQINGFFRLVDGSGTEYYLVHHDTTLTELAMADGAIDWDGTHTDLTTSMADARSVAFAYDNKLYILDGTTYWVYDGSTVETVAVDNTSVPTNTFIPTTTIGSGPTGGGTEYEAVNLLSPWRINQFAGNGSAQDFTVDTGSIDDATDLVVVVDGTTLTVTTDYTVTYATGVVHFNVAPSDQGGVDNVYITFAKTVSGYADRINQCKFAMWYGAGEYSRVFVSGNPSYRNYDWCSGLYDPTYFPDTGYTIFGSSAAGIMGYHRQYDNMLIVKEDNNQDATLFVRTAELDDNDNVIFPVQQGLSGVGAVSMYSFATLRDEPLFLAKQGVYTPTLVYGGAKQERTMQNRSFFINARLTIEDNMDEAVAVTWDGYYVLSINGHCYVADSRQKTSKSKTEGTSYEWYYWTNIDARVFTEIDDILYFGTSSGDLCKFRSDDATGNRYNDDMDAVDAIWATKQDDDGNFMLLKTMERLGSGVMIKPYSRSSVEISIKTEENTSTTLNSMNVDIFDFNNMDFTRFTFDTNDNPRVMPFGLNVRRYRTLQIIARNNETNEGFGVYGFIKNYHPVRNVR